VIAFNNKPIKNRDELGSDGDPRHGRLDGSGAASSAIGRRRPSTSRSTELDLEAETQPRNRRPRQSRYTQPQESSAGFGMTLSNITPDMAQRLRLDRNVQGAVIVDVDQDSAAARAGLTQGDIIVRVGREDGAERGRGATRAREGTGRRNRIPPRRAQRPGNVRHR
jgi:serine protease Do